MKLNFMMDISDRSCSFSHTPNLASLKMPFFLYDFGNFYAKSGYFTEREGVDNYLLFYTLSGSGKLIYRNSEYKLEEKQAAIINCNEYHYYKTGDEGSWNFLWIHLNGLSCANYFDLINENSLNIVDFAADSCLEDCFNKICRIKSTDEPLCDVKFSMLLTNIITHMVVNRFNLGKSDSFSHNKELVNSVFSYIQKNYRKKISLDELAEFVHISKYHLIRIFTKHSGTSPYEYLINFRIDKSKMLLKETNHPVNEISNLVGYNDVTNFIRDFKKYLGTTPLKYRNYWIN
jgi:YesN/AraC family two-component response regulator